MDSGAPVEAFDTAPFHGDDVFALNIGSVLQIEGSYEESEAAVCVSPGQMVHEELISALTGVVWISRVPQRLQK